MCSLRSSFFSCGQAPVRSWQLTGPLRSGGGVQRRRCQCLRVLESDAPALFFPLPFLNRCQQLKVNSVVGGTGVRAAFGLTLSPQTWPVRAGIWLVRNAKRSQDMAAPISDAVSSVGAAAVRDRGPLPPQPWREGGYQRAAHVLKDPLPSPADRGLNSQGNKPIIFHTELMEGRREAGPGAASQGGACVC